MPGWDPGRRALDGTIGSDRLISLTRTDEGRRYFSLDGLRSVVNLTDDSGNEVASYHLDAWGNFRFPDELTQSGNRFAFTGHIYDQETGLYNAKARYFDPKLGRFLTQDSYLGRIDNPPSLHRYAYGHNRPTYYIDPDGHLVFIPIAIGIVKVAALVGAIVFEADVIHQEISEGKNLSTVNYGEAAKKGAIAAGATAAGGLAGAGALAGTAALGIGGAAGSAAISGTVGGAVAGYSAGAGETLAGGGSLAQAHDRGAIGALTGAVGGVAGQAAGSLATRVGAGRAGSAFAAGAAGDYAGQQTLVGAGLQEKASITQSLAVGGASAITGIVAESSRGHGKPPTPKDPPDQGAIQELAGNELKVGDVMAYREYLARRTRGSTLRGHHTPQAARLEEMGIDPMEGTVVVVENKVVGPGGEKLGHTGTRTHGVGGSRAAAAERGKPLSISETKDLLDPPVERLGPEVGIKVQDLNRKKFPDKF